MKASEAKILTAKHKELRETVRLELESIYTEIERGAVNGVSAFHYHRGWLNSNDAANVFVTKETIKRLVDDGYNVEKHLGNPNKPWLLISWL